jgi:hypothetical protein
VREGDGQRSDGERGRREGRGRKMGREGKEMWREREGEGNMERGMDRLTLYMPLQEWCVEGW